MLALFIVVAIAIIYVIFLTFKILDNSPGNEQTIQLSEIIQKGARSFLIQEYVVFLPVVLSLAFCLFIFLGWVVAFSFLTGALFSTLSGFFGMTIATKTNARTSWAALSGMSRALKIAFSGGAVMGLTVSALGLFGLGFVYELAKDMSVISYYSLGASFVALFARVGGGIYTKAADVGADIVGKTEANLPEDDPRNPAVIADNVGDNVGDVAGMGADLYESYVGSIFSALALGSFLGDRRAIQVVLFVVISGLVSSLFSVIITTLTTQRFKDSATALRFGSILSSSLLLVSTFAYSLFISWLSVFFVVFFGVIVGVFVGLLTELYTSGKRITNLAKTALTGSSNILISGLALGMESTAIVTVLIAVAVLLSYKLLGLFGVALSAVGMLATLGMNLSIDAYGPIADNAGGIAQMAKLEEKARRVTDQLDAVGNTTAAMGKGFAITSAALTSLALFSNYASTTHIGTFDIRQPQLFVGALVGAMLPFLFSALTMKAVGDAADEMVQEIRRQIKEIPGIITGQTQPEYNRCIQIATKGALRRMILPSLLAVIAPVTSYLVLGVAGTAGLLIGSTVCGVMVAVFMANSGGAWDNAKKYIEEGHFGGKGSIAHMAAVVGDTVGDPLKDTAGPSINILIKLMAITSVVIATLMGR
ncbi:sodium-translocating pyrophosphatase [Pseudothermotoga sp. U03pept]|uniref:sodium-translocating pyrophosphatase n=1 Tax=Pseudothermotoga sp. U03pept TaxID=3447012 RepID=UPI003F0DB624